MTEPGVPLKSRAYAVGAVGAAGTAAETAGNSGK